MNEHTKEFLEQFTNLNNEDFRVSFADIFTEFIDILNNLDLSDKTLLYINELFNKDMQLFFIDMEIKRKNFVSKQKVKDEIDKHKIAKEGFEKEYYNKHYEDDGIRARDFYGIITQDRIIQVLEELLEDK